MLRLDGSLFRAIQRPSAKLLLLLFWAMSGAAAADETVDICYNYGCSQQAEARFSEQQLQILSEELRSASSAAEERDALADVIGRLYYWAGQQTPIYADKGGNTDDGGENGEMDCIDHSKTTTRLLQMLQRRGFLNYHKVADIALRHRFLLFDHFSAVVEELPPPMSTSVAFNVDGEIAKPRRYVIDSWFVDNGQPAIVLPLENWMRGGGAKPVVRH